MPTTVVKTIRASGGDYTTLSAWEAANQGNLVAADEVRVAECYNDWPSGLNDAVNIDGSTTDATRYMAITVAVGHRHDGTPGTGFKLYYATGTYNAVLKSTNNYTVIEWVEVENTAAANGAYAIHLAQYGGARNCIAKCRTNALSHAFYLDHYGTHYNLLAYGGATGILMRACTVLNSVVANCTTGVQSDHAGAVLKNSCSYNNTTNYTGTFSASSTNNATSTGSDDAPGGSSVYGVTSAAFVNAASNDFHLASGSVLIGAGANLYSTFTTDIDGDTRPSSGAWDIGFDQVVGGGTSTVSSDLADNYVVRNIITSDLTDSYALRSAVTTDLTDSYTLTNFVQTDLTDSYALRSVVTSDLTDSYTLTNFVQTDLTDSYALRSAVTSDLTDSYALRSAVTSDLTDSYDIVVAGTVTSDHTDTYTVRNTVISDHDDTYSVHNVVNSDFVDMYSLRNFVQNDIADSYTLTNFVQTDYSDNYDLRNLVNNDFVDSYLLRNVTLSDISDSYAIYAYIQNDIADSYIVNSDAPFTQVQLDYLLAYMQENLMIPTAEEIAAAILAAAQLTPIHADIQKVNNVDVGGTGSELDPWGPQ